MKPTQDNRIVEVVRIDGKSRFFPEQKVVRKTLFRKREIVTWQRYQITIEGLMLSFDTLQDAKNWICKGDVVHKVDCKEPSLDQKIGEMLKECGVVWPTYGEKDLTILKIKQFIREQL